MLEPAAGLGFGGVLGLGVGYATKKLGKLFLLLFGLLVVLLQGLAHLELITVDWNAVHATASDVWQTSDGSLGERAWEVVASNLPFGGGFLAGFTLGFKMGGVLRNGLISCVVAGSRRCGLILPTGSPLGA